MNSDKIAQLEKNTFLNKFLYFFYLIQKEQLLNKLYNNLSDNIKNALYIKNNSFLTKLKLALLLLLINQNNYEDKQEIYKDIQNIISELDNQFGLKQIEKVFKEFKTKEFKTKQLNKDYISNYINKIKNSWEKFKQLPTYKIKDDYINYLYLNKYSLLKKISTQISVDNKPLKYFFEKYKDKKLVYKQLSNYYNFEYHLLLSLMVSEYEILKEMNINVKDIIFGNNTFYFKISWLFKEKQIDDLEDILNTVLFLNERYNLQLKIYLQMLDNKKLKLIGNINGEEISFNSNLDKLEKNNKYNFFISGILTYIKN